jgi:hypothetical protein
MNESAGVCVFLKTALKVLMDDIIRGNGKIDESPPVRVL